MFQTPTLTHFEETIDNHRCQRGQFNLLLRRPISDLDDTRESRTLPKEPALLFQTRCRSTESVMLSSEKNVGIFIVVVCACFVAVAVVLALVATASSGPLVSYYFSDYGLCGVCKVPVRECRLKKNYSLVQMPLQNESFG